MKVMILGASGLCGTSLVPLMEQLYDGVELVLVDPAEEPNPRVVRAAPEVKEIWHILKAFGLSEGDVLIDLTPELSKLDVMQAADSVGVSVINATACERERGAISVIDLIDRRLLLARYKWNAPHMVGAGMNPGNINALLGMMVAKYGRPDDVTQWELDSTIPFEWDGEGFATWSPPEFASEFADESTWEADGKTLIFADGPPIDNLVVMPDGNQGALCQHEEIVKWAWTYGCRARYLYGYSPDAMQAIDRNIRDGLELPLCRKLKGRIPTGGDCIGIKAIFGEVEVNGTISAQNDSDLVPIGSNATSYLVSCGVATAFKMLTDFGKRGINWPDDFGEKWIKFLADNRLCDIEVAEG